MAVYILMFLSSVGLTYISTKSGKRKLQKNICRLLAISIPILVAAFRYDNGVDYLMYDTIYHKIGETGTFNSVKSLEFGFHILVSACNVITSNSWLLFFLAALIICYFYMNGCFLISKNITLSVVLFFVTGTFFDSFNGIRQYMAASLSFFAFYYLLKGNFKKYCICILIGFSFHFTVLLMLPIYLVRKIEIDIKKSLLFVAVVLIGGNLFYRLVSFILQFTRYRYFLTSIEYEIMPTEAAIFYVLLIQIISILIILKYKGNKTKSFQILYNLQVITVCIVLLSLSVPLIWRVEYYFLPIEILFLPELLTLVKRKSNRFFVSLMLVSMYVIIIVIYGMNNQGWYDSLPYNFYFTAIRY